MPYWIFASIFLFLWSTCCLLSALKECFISLLQSNSIFIAVLRLKLWLLALIQLDFNFFNFKVIAHFSRFLVLSHYPVIDSSYITLLAFKIKHNWYHKVLEDTDYDFNGFDTTFSKNLIDFFLNRLNCRFYFVFLVVWIFTVQWPRFIAFSWENRWDDILILVDSWYFPWLWKQLFSKLKKHFLTSQFCSFYCLVVI